MPEAVNLPVVMSKSGLVPQTPTALLQQLIALVSATNPGYTANLPGSLIEDISSTDVGALIVCDQARVELVNSLTPYGANAFLLNQLGQIYGVTPGVGSNTSVYVVFTGTPGFVIGQGFLVSDGTYSYAVQNGGVVLSSGQSAPLYALAVSSGTWAVPANTVNIVQTSVPSTYTLTVTNPETGTPGSGSETETAYRARVLQAGLAVSQGLFSFLKATLTNIPGVQPRLIAAQPQVGGGWKIIAGGGDPYAVAYGIYYSLFDISTLTGSVLSVTGITQAANAEISTDLNHGYTAGETITITGATPTSYDFTADVVTVIDEKTFTVNYDTSMLAAWTSGGVLTPNLRNISVTIHDYPDNYVIPFVNPPQQTVSIALTWNTNSPNYVSPAAVSQLGTPALVTYINSIPVGQPINVFELEDAFQNAIQPILDPPFLTRMVFSVAINGVGTSPIAGTGIIEGDPESYFYTTAADISITQG